jgi:hypothetical protein
MTPAPHHEVSTENLMQDTTNIARWVRLSGSPEELAAVQYVEERLRSFGFATRLLQHDAYISLPGRASLTVSGLGSVACITHSFSAAGDYELLLADGADATAEATGKALLADGLADGEQELDARQRGAAALIMVNAAYTHEMIISNVWGSPTADQLQYLPQLPVISITAADGARLREQLRLGPVAVRIHTELDTGWRRIPLLVADLPGTAEPDNFVLFSGHIDSWHYGAMDNGSANATMMEVGRILAGHRDALRRGIRLAFWSGHSHGRYAGSTWYADNYWQELYDHCVCHVNIDSVGARGATVLSEAMCMPETRALAAAAVRQVAPGVGFRGSRVNRSGDQSFTGVGIPSLFMTVSEHPEGAPTATTMWGPGTGGLGWWWHTTEDLVDKLDPDFLRRDAAIYLAAVWQLTTEAVLPFDYTATACEVRDLLATLQRGAGDAFDLSPTAHEAEQLVADAALLSARLETLRTQPGGGPGAPGRVAAANRCLMRLGRCLIPVVHTAAGPYRHDLAFAVPPLPGLAAVGELAGLDPDSDAYKFRRPGFVRAQNGVVHALRQARVAIALALNELGEAN